MQLAPDTFTQFVILPHSSQFAVCAVEITLHHQSSDSRHVIVNLFEWFLYEIDVQLAVWSENDNNAARAPACENELEKMAYASRALWKRGM